MLQNPALVLCFVGADASPVLLFCGRKEGSLFNKDENYNHGFRGQGRTQALASTMSEYGHSA